MQVSSHKSPETVGIAKSRSNADVESTEEESTVAS